jgi:hypothetical protein
MAEIENENSMLYWFPRIENLGIPIPRTAMIKSRLSYADACDMVDGKKNSRVEVLFEQVEEAASSFAFPVFLRGDQSANKHDWNKSCYVVAPARLRSAMVNITEFAFIVDIGIAGYAIREFLDLDWRFKAFNGMPIAAERRYFVRDGNVECWHPYWPETAIERPTSKNWLQELRELQAPRPGEVELLARHAETIGKALGGYWSVDFCRHSNGTWYVTDMARGDDSYHWGTCPRASPVMLARYGSPVIQDMKGGKK